MHNATAKIQIRLWKKKKTYKNTTRDTSSINQMLRLKTSQEWNHNRCKTFYQCSLSRCLHGQLTSPQSCPLMTKRLWHVGRPNCSLTSKHRRNLNLSATHRWIMFGVELIQFGFDSNITHMQSSVAVLGAAADSAVTQSGRLTPCDSVCSQRSDGNHT